VRFRHLTWPLVLAILVAATGCAHWVPRARSAADYELKAKNTAEAVLSAVQTARLTVGVVERDRAFPAYVAVTVGEAEADANGAASTFSAIQPPDAASDGLRAELGDVTDAATDALAAVRIAARRSDADAVVAEAGRLRQIADDLRAFLAEHS
jgi:hypothetical protein